MKYIYIILFMFFIGSLFAQQYVLGKGKVLNYWTQEYIDCQLYLLDNKYTMKLSLISDDIVFNMFPLYGYVRKEGNLYYLKDIPTNAEIVLEKDKSANFNIKKGFSFMQNEYFIYEGKADSDDFSWFDIDVEYAKKKKEVQSIRDKPLPDKLKFGFGEYMNGNVRVFLEENGSYTIAYKFQEYLFVISEGRWSTRNGILELRDSFLNYSFTMLISVDRELIAIDFPDELNEERIYSFVEGGNKYKK